MDDMKKKNTYLIEYIEYDENHIPFVDKAEIHGDDEQLAIIEFRVNYGAEIIGISEKDT